MAFDTEQKTADKSVQQAQGQQILMTALTERSNMLDVLKASGVVKKDATSFTFADVAKQYNDHFKKSDWNTTEAFAGLQFVDRKGAPLGEDQNAALLRATSLGAGQSTFYNPGSTSYQAMKAVSDEVLASEIDSSINPGSRAATTPWIESQRKAARNAKQTTTRAIEKDLINPDCKDLNGDFKALKKDPANAGMSDKDLLFKLAMEKATKAFEAAKSDPKFKGMKESELIEAVATATAKRFEYHRSHKLGRSIEGSIEKDLKQYVGGALAASSAPATTPTLGSSIEALLQKNDGTEAVTKARESLLRQFPLSELRAAFPELADAFATLETSLKNTNGSLETARTNLTTAETNLKDGKFTGLKNMLGTIVGSDEYKALDKTTPGIKTFTDEIEALSKLMEDPKADADAVYKRMKTAVDNAQKFIPDSTEFPGEKDLNDPKNEAFYKCIVKITGYEGAEAPGLNETYLDSVKGLTKTKLDMAGALKTAQENAAKDIAAAETKFKTDIDAKATELAQSGNIRLRAVLDSRKDITDSNGNLIEAKYTYYDTNEEALYATNAVTKGYESAFSPINKKVEAEIAAMNDPRISRVLAQAKDAEAKFLAGDHKAFFKGVNEEALGRYLADMKANMTEGKTGQELKDAQKEFEAISKKINMAAGYINFTYMRGQIEGDDRVSMTGAEATARAHYLDNQRGKKEELVRNAAKVREYESLSLGNQYYRHGIGNKYGASVLTENFNKEQGSGKSALESFDIAASDVAGKALLPWTEGMGRIQHNISGMLHRNLNTRALIEAGLFFVGRALGSSFFHSAPKTITNPPFDA